MEPSNRIKLLGIGGTNSASPRVLPLFDLATQGEVGVRVKNNTVMTNLMIKDLLTEDPNQDLNMDNA